MWSLWKNQIVWRQINSNPIGGRILEWTLAEIGACTHTPLFLTTEQSIGVPLAFAAVLPHTSWTCYNQMWTWHMCVSSQGQTKTSTYFTAGGWVHSIVNESGADPLTTKIRAKRKTSLFWVCGYIQCSVHVLKNKCQIQMECPQSFMQIVAVKCLLEFFCRSVFQTLQAFLL